MYYVFNLRFCTDLDFKPRAKTINIKSCDEYNLEYSFTRVYTDLLVAKEEMKKIIDELLENIRINSIRDMLMDAYGVIDLLNKSDENKLIIIREFCIDGNYEGTCIEFLTAE